MSTLSKHTHSLVAIVGRPNVGKSTLFNKIIHKRQSLVADQPGVTRDRIFGQAQHNGTSFFICDTGGFEPTSLDNVKKQLVEQATLAIEEAQVIVFLADGKEGLHPVDAELVKFLRKAGKTFFVAVNKIDNVVDSYGVDEFRQLGVSHLYPISAEHSLGIADLIEDIVEVLPKRHGTGGAPGNEDDSVHVAIVGRPNVGKSSLLNRICGSHRAVVDPRPGTTRDPVDAILKSHGKKVHIVDTAGIRRKSRMSDKLEHFSALRAVANIEEAHVAVLVIDAQEGPTEGDARVAGYAFERRKPILIVVNKWDLIENKTDSTVREFEDSLRSSLRYISYAPIVFVSALENLRASRIIPLCLELFEESSKRVPTSKVNEVLKQTLEKHTPPLTATRSRRINFKFATQVASCPPRFIIFCSHPQDIHFTYKRFMENSFRSAFDFKNVPISLTFRESGTTRASHQSRWTEETLGSV